MIMLCLMYNGQAIEHGQYIVNTGTAEMVGALSWEPQIKFCLGPIKPWAGSGH